MSEDIEAEIIKLNKRISITRQRLNEPKKPEHIMQNWSLSCLLVKHLTKLEELRKKLPPPTLT